MRKTGVVNIVTTSWHRDSRLERRLIEYRREAIIFGIILFGAIIMLVGLLW
jgi:hypothetical protein